VAISSIAALFGAMTIIALTPDASAAAVIARSASSGLAHGLTVVLGIIVGDIVFIALVFSGLSFVAESMSGVFLAVKLLGACYLFWLGFNLLIHRSTAPVKSETGKLNWYSDLTCGLLITLGDPKAIVFYLSFLPAYMDLTTATVGDALVIFLIAALSIGIAKGGYAYFAGRATGYLRSTKSARIISISSGGVMIVTGMALLAQT
jgi:threonine/homoserine/homoserine lactone efflux protein